ncbi:MAG: hypothetical protein JNL54_03990 [Kineosporiaceae bacterium]|nr:hypothetical protein [Kineosporiaceae bacterium]
MLVLTRYLVPPQESAEFHALAVRALEVLTERLGCTGGRLGRTVDDPSLWTITTSWRSVGDYRRALSHVEVKLHAVPVMYRAIDEPTAYEDLLTWDPATGFTGAASDRAPDADTTGPGHER